MLEEAIEAFLRQDYEGEKELVVLNDFDQQVLRFEHPEVRVINTPTRFATIGEKRNAAIAACSHDLIAVWDDDDICLPHRLSYSMKSYDPELRFYKGNCVFMYQYGRIKEIRNQRPHAASLWHRSLFNEVGGYAEIDSGEDKDLELRFWRVIPYREFPIDDHDVYYIYRWWATGSYHLSQPPIANNPDGPPHERILAYAMQEIRHGRAPTGFIELRPNWSADWPAVAAEFLSGQPTMPSPA
jgi:glycosyltransferase involved in cell wall biosynthesis